jgi:hypothetical protein
MVNVIKYFFISDICNEENMSYDIDTSGQYFKKIFTYVCGKEKSFMTMTLVVNIKKVFVPDVCYKEKSFMTKALGFNIKKVFVTDVCDKEFFCDISIKRQY